MYFCDFMVRSWEDGWRQGVDCRIAATRRTCRFTVILLSPRLIIQGKKSQFSGSTAIVDGQGSTSKMFAPSLPLGPHHLSKNCLNSYKLFPGKSIKQIQNLGQRGWRRIHSAISQLQGPEREQPSPMPGRHRGGGAQGSLENESLKAIL